MILQNADGGLDDLDNEQAIMVARSSFQVAALTNVTQTDVECRERRWLSMAAATAWSTLAPLS